MHLQTYFREKCGGSFTEAFGMCNLSASGNAFPEFRGFVTFHGCELASHVVDKVIPLLQLHFLSKFTLMFKQGLWIDWVVPIKKW